MKTNHLPGEIDWVMAWFEAQLDAGRQQEQINADPYYQRLHAAMKEARLAKWGRCADCPRATQACVREMLLSGQQVEPCPLKARP